MIVRLSWKNIWRSKRRSFTVIGAIVIGVWALIFMIGFYNSFTYAFSRNAIAYEHSHLQIHNPEYLVEPDIKFTISDTDKILSASESIPAIESVSSRQKVTGMVASSKNNLGVQIFGIFPEDEAAVTGLKDFLVDGSYFEKIRRNPILLSKEMAEKLGVKVRSKVVLTFQDVDREITAASFRVEGIFDSKQPTINKGVVYIKQSDLSRLSGTEGVHEIAFLLNDNEALLPTQAELQKSTVEKVQTYSEIAPMFDLMEQSTSTTKQVLVIIIMLALLFGIINTMLMAVLERTREIGMLRSIGMHKGKVFSMIVYETIFMGILAGPLGALFGYLTIQWFNKNGMDLSNYADSLKSYGYDAIFYPVLDNATYFSLMLIVVITAFVGAIYPAFKAVQLNPLEAIRKL